MQSCRRVDARVGQPNLPTLVFVHGDGRRESHPAVIGTTVMDCAMDNGVAGIYAQCGGGCTCSTCHGFVAGRWFASVGAAVGDERDILEFRAWAATHQPPNLPNRGESGA